MLNRDRLSRSLAQQVELSLSERHSAAQASIDKRVKCFAAALSRHISSEASIFLSGTAEFDESIRRFSQTAVPGFVASVEVGTEEDVSSTVRGRLS